MVNENNSISYKRNSQGGILNPKILKVNDNDDINSNLKREVKETINTIETTEKFENIFSNTKITNNLSSTYSFNTTANNLNVTNCFNTSQNFNTKNSLINTTQQLISPYSTNFNKNSLNNLTKQYSSSNKLILQDGYQKTRYSNIINETMLLEQVKKHNLIRRNTPEEEIFYARILILENKNISFIQNLNLFENLEELYLDNNKIERLENLNFLRRLQKLSASNNNIREIENLEGLTELTELNLHNNKITKIQNLEKNTKLCVLTLSKNRIRDLQNLENLKHLSKLKFLNLLDNPICEMQNFYDELNKNLRHIQYVNNTSSKRFFGNIREKSKGRKCYPIFSDSYPNANNKDAAAWTALDKCKEQYITKLKDAFISELPHICNLLFDQQKEPPILLKIETYEIIKKKYLEQLSEQTSGIIHRVLELNDERNESLANFHKKLEDILQKNMEFHINEYENLKDMSKLTVRNILSFINSPGGVENLSLVTYPYQKDSDINKMIDLEEIIKSKFEGVSINNPDINHLNFKIKNEWLGFYIPDKDEKEKSEPYQKNKSNNNNNNNNNNTPIGTNKNSYKRKQIKTRHFILDKHKYRVLKNYIDNHIEENYIFGRKLINEELKNMVALNNFMEQFRKSIAKLVKIITNNISTYFKTINELETLFNAKITEYLPGNANTTTNTSVKPVAFSEEEINEYYAFKAHRANILSNIHESISNNYNSSYNELVDMTKKDVFVKSRERIDEIRKIIIEQNNLFYTYFSVVHSDPYEKRRAELNSAY